MKSFRFYLLAALLLGLLPLTPARAQLYDWATQVHDLNYNHGNATDGAGNTYGSFYLSECRGDSARINNQTYFGTAGNVLIVKFTNTGQIAWVQQIAGWETHRLAGDPSAAGGFFLTASATAGAIWPGAVVPGAGTYYAKCSPAGALLWLHPIPRGPIPVPQYLAEYVELIADGLGNCYLAEHVYGGPFTLGGVAFDSSSLYLAQITPAGTVGWATKVYADYTSPNNYAGVLAFKVGGKSGGGCLMVGDFGGTAHFGVGPTAPTITASVSNTSRFLANFDATGTLLWSRMCVGAIGGRDALDTGLATDAAGNCYWSGGGWFPVSFGPGQSTIEGPFVVKYDAVGNFQWLRTQQAGDVNNTSTKLVVSPEGLVSVAMSISPVTNAVFGPFTVSGLTGESDCLVQYNAQGQEQWVAQGGERAGMNQDSVGNGYLLSVPLFSWSGSVTTYGPFTLIGEGMQLVRINGHANQLSGRAYLDANTNGQRDPGEVAFPYPPLVELTSNGRTTVATPYDSTSTYFAFADTGAYTLTLPIPPLHYTVSEPAGGTYTGSFPRYGMLDSTRHFGFAPIPNQPDVRLTLTAVSALRRGIPLTYRVTLDNTGTVPVPSGTVTLTLDPAATYIGSVPAATATGQTLTWTYANLAPTERHTFDLRFSLPITLPLGTNVVTSAQALLSGDVLPTDNAETVEGPVIGSYDPNDIAVNHQRLTPAQVAAGQPLDYTVRFQNMGTDTAFVVVVTDTLPADLLRVASLQLIAQSHNCTWLVSGTGVLTVRFLNIRLPQASVSPLNSQGFVRFRVRPRATLVAGDLIPNRADIFFDFNVPVTTNDATTLVQTPNGLVAELGAGAWSLYPNPATAANAVTLTTDVATAGPATVRVLDALGRVVRTQDIAVPAGPLRYCLNVRGLAPGLYVVRLALPDDIATARRLVVGGQ